MLYNMCVSVNVSDLSGGFGELFLHQLHKLAAIVLSLLLSLKLTPVEVLQG